MHIAGPLVKSHWTAQGAMHGASKKVNVKDIILILISLVV